MTPALRDNTSAPGYSPQMARWSWWWAFWMDASTWRSEEKGSFSVVGMFWSSTAGERMSTSSRGRSSVPAMETKPCRASRSSTSSAGAGPCQAA